jgi:predicted transcriptional regulator
MAFTFKVLRPLIVPDRVIDSPYQTIYTFGMEVHLTPEKEAQLHQLATRTGKETAQVVEEAVDRLLEYDACFIAAVEEGRAAARRGDLLEHEEVVERIERMFRT